jgi:hypothetical protein
VASQAGPSTLAVCPVWTRLFETLPGSPLVVGALVAGALLLAFAALDLLDGNWNDLLAGEVPFWAHVEIRSALVVAALLAGIAVTHRFEEGGVLRDLVRLLPRLRRPLDADALARSVSEVDRRSLRVAGSLGALVILAVVPSLYLEPSRFLRPETYALPSVLFDLAVGALVGWTLSKTLWAGIVQDRAFARLSREVAQIDLLDLTPLRPFVRRGQRRMLRFVVLAAIAAFVFFDAGYLAPPALAFLGIVAFATFSFVLPVWGIHVRIRDEKRETLARLREEIRRERAAVTQRLEEGPSRESRDGGGHLADLLAWEARIASVREWPLDVSTVLRALLILLLPVGSWLGGAFVERLVDAALG